MMINKQELPKIQPKKIDDEEFTLKDLKFEFDLSKTNYQLDRLQNKFLEFYLRSDHRFRKAFYSNYTNDFIGYIRDKARLREPVHLSIMGSVRSFTDENFIFTDNGWRKPDDMFNCQEILSYNFDLEKYEWKKFELVKRKRNLQEKFFKITFYDNREIILGENHPIFTKLKGWKKAYSLYKNIDIPFFTNFQQKYQENKYSIELVRLIAFMLSCGHLNGSSYNQLDKRDNKIYNKQSYGISYCSGSKGNIDKFRKDFQKEFGLEIKYKKKRKNYNGIEIEISNKEIFFILANYVPIGKKSHIIEIPSFVFNSNKDIHREFISTLFSGDGYISKKEKMPIVEYYSMSDKFIKQLQLILSQYNIISKIEKKKVKNYTFINRLRITGKINLLAFIDFVKTMSNEKKNQRIKDMKKRLLKQKIQKTFKPFFIKDVQEIKIDKDIIYDIFVEDNHNFFLDGILTKNSGKSYTALTLGAIHQACYGRKLTIDYICGNSQEYIEKIKRMSNEKVNDRVFIIDEDKGFFNIGSNARKQKLLDVANIIARANISTISLCPTKFTNSESSAYGIRLFGRCWETGTTRSMLYNLQESAKLIPVGNLYLPIFTKLLPKDYYEPLEKAYLEKKDKWIEGERDGSGGDVLANIRKKYALDFMKDKQYIELKKKGEKLAYLTQVLGSEWTKSEVENVFEITKLLEKGVTFK